ncbi:MAG: putative bacillithiol system oxidoreductase, YpdA family [Acidobacteria bacterium]|nr:putative bacillithiol system oxidoreductase, YpdA family [Acidobacteriota bacterium]
MTRRLAIAGAGPIGLAAAAEALDRGWDVTVFERGEIGSALDRWGPVRCFTPLRMNLPERLLAAVPEVDLDAYLTGPEMRARVLEPLVARTALRDRVLTRHRVTAIGRRGLTRTDFPGHPLRAERPFVLQVDADGIEKSFEADVVFDATGGFALANAFGAGGLPARGERSVEAETIRDHASLDAASLSGRRVLLVGHGHSAANALHILERQGASVVWAVRTPNRRPCVEMANDPLPERDATVSRANDLAAAPPEWLRVERRAAVVAVERAEDGLHVQLSANREVVVDRIAAFTGYHPDSSHITELPAETSPVTEGGARLYRAIANVTDCLSVPNVSPSDLESGEPGFYFIGSRSYGRARTFLLQTGMAQLAALFGRL